MKFFLLLIIISLFNSLIFCQTVDTLYLDRKMNILNNSKKYKYLRVITKVNDSLYNVVEHYKNGEIKMVGFYSSVSPVIKVGRSDHFDRKGNKVSIIDHNVNILNKKIKKKYIPENTQFDIDTSKFNFVITSNRKYNYEGLKLNEKMFGYWYYYNKSGELNYMLEYRNGDMNGTVIDVFDSNDDVQKHFHGKIHIIGYHNNAKRDSTWKYYRPNGKIYQIRVYKNGKKVSRIKY